MLAARILRRGLSNAGSRFHGPTAPTRSTARTTARTLTKMTAADEDAIKATITKFYKGFDKKVGVDHSTKSTVGEEMRFIRPTGNPLSMAGFQDMMKSDLVTRSTNEVLSFEKIHVGTDSAMCCIVHRDIFDYDGHENDDVAVTTYYLTKVEGEWKIFWGQRSKGRPPADPKPTGF